MDRLIEFTSVAGPGAFVVHRLDVQEALAGIPECRLDLLSLRTDLSPGLMLGTTAAAALRPGPGQPPRWFHGHVTRFSCTGPWRSPAFGGAQACRYEVVLRPGLWFLTRRSDCRVFRQITTSALLADRLADAGAMATSVDLGPGPVRDFVVQYRETDFQFVSRWAEHVGACWHVEHQAQSHRLVVTDRPGHGAQDPVVLRVADRGAPPLLVALSLQHRVQSGSFAGTDHLYATPRTSLAASASQPQPHAHADEARFDAPSGAATPEEAEAQARLQLEAHACRHARLRGVALSTWLRAGGLARVVQHPVAAMNGDWLVTSLHLAVTNNLAQSGDGEGIDVRAEFEAIPAATPYRPPRATPRPVIAGVQAARVVADFRDDAASASSTGAGTGRVRVAFGWDRRARASCPLRVAQPWAGRGYGFQNMPRVGDEVLVQFMEGDPDRPVVVGRLHDAEARPPWPLPRYAALTGFRTASLDAQGRSIASRFNELRFDDTAGTEQVYLQAQRHLDERVGGDRHASVDGASHRVVQGDDLDAVAGDRHAHVDGQAAARVGRSLRLTVGDDLHVRALAGRAALQVADEVHMRAGGRLVLEAGQGVTVRCGASFLELDASGVRIDGPLVALRCGGQPGTGQGASAADPGVPRPAMRSDGSRPASPG